MQVFRVVLLQKPRQIGLELGKAGAGDGGEGERRRHVAHERRKPRGNGGLRPAARQAKAALGLAGIERNQQKMAREILRQGMERVDRARAEFELDLAQRLGFLAGDDLADIERHLHAAAAGGTQLPGRAPETGFEHRHEPGAPFFPDQPVDEVGRQARQIRHRPRHRGLQFQPCRQAAAFLALGLQGLQPAPPDPAHAQGDAVAGEVELRGVEIDRAQSVPLGTRPRKPGQRGKRRGVVCTQPELELGFG